MGLVKGFTDIIAPQNLVTNGSFRINQRGLFPEGSGFQPVKVGDYLCDAWSISQQTVDYLSYYHDIQGLARFSGYGKKGQYFTVANRDSIAVGYPAKGNDRELLTAAVAAKITSGIPLSINCNPRYYTSSVSTEYQRIGVLSVKEPETRAVRVMSTLPHVTNSSPAFQVILLADGEFSFVVAAFQEHVGGYVNPPQFAPISYADDLLRCKRYYQSGNVNLYALGADTGTEYILANFINFDVQMAGTPTMGYTSAVIKEEGSEVDVTGSYTHGINAVHSKGFFGYAAKAAGGSKPSRFAYAWTATV